MTLWTLGSTGTRSADLPLQDEAAGARGASHGGDALPAFFCSQYLIRKKDMESPRIQLHGAPRPHACLTGAKRFRPE